ncbi:MAG: PilT/PilU family type 4a pilus ATPase [candidate division WS1 bacterium]|jgi:twitching motility protein PilT|nr:PilT/PilU family type 4a pilus ATPase [candidate division WS1 bacterium]
MGDDFVRRTVKAPPDLSNAAGRTMDAEVVELLLHACEQLGASDLHLSFNEPPIFRLHGKMYRVEGYKTLDEHDCIGATSVLLGEDDPTNRYWQQFHETGGADIAAAIDTGARFRVSVFQQKGHPAIALRMIPNEILTFEQLGLPVEQVKELLHRPRGIILLTGPTGCGKTTTIASMVDYINRERDTHIITIEDPIEYYHHGKRSLLNQREVGVDVSSFAESVRRNMRSDPDVMLVGEMRDLETMRACLQAAETGHLVLSTLHTVSAPKTVDRLVTGFPSSEQEEIRAMTSTSLLAVFSEELIPRKSGKGRVAAYEIMIGEPGGSPAIGNLIRERKSSQMRSTIQSSRHLGMQLLESNLAKLVREDIVAFEEAYNRANQKTDLLQFLEGYPIPEEYLASAERADNS